MGHLGIPHLGGDDTQPHCQLTEQTTPIVCPQPAGGGDGHAGCWARSGPASSSTSLGSLRRREARSDLLCSGWTGPSQLRTEPPLPGEAAPHQPCEGTQPGPPPRSPACRNAPFGEPPASNSLQGHRQGGISLPRELAPWMRLAPACTGVRGAFQNIRMADSHQQGAERGCVPYLARRHLPSHLGFGPGTPVQGRCCGSLTSYWKFPFAPRSRAQVCAGSKTPC